MPAPLPDVLLSRMLFLAEASSFALLGVLPGGTLGDEEVLGTGMMREELTVIEPEALAEREPLVRLSESRRAPVGDGDERGSGPGEEHSVEVEQGQGEDAEAEAETGR